IMAGVDNQLSVTGIKIISHSETPGLGANITSDDFCRQFSGKDLTDSHWKLKQNGGTVDQISGATISTRAVTKAVHTGLTFYAENKEKILKISSQ
ncbi:MAG: FMN-binding protein, partial [Deltaproteobacteria bacterium]|nr:FMN-binding protein [Deltaproteobacteria bacterium]